MFVTSTLPMLAIRSVTGPISFSAISMRQPLHLTLRKPCSNRPPGEVVVELLGDEARQMGAVFGDLTQELRQVLFDDGIERRFLRLVSPVADQIGCAIQPGLRVD